MRSVHCSAQSCHHRQHERQQANIRIHLKRQHVATLLSALGLPDPQASLCTIFSCVGDVKDKVYTPPLPANINDIKDQITTAINTVDRNMLRHIWNEFSYWLYVVLAASGDHIEDL